MARGDQSTRQICLLSILEKSRYGLAIEEMVETLPDGYPKNPRTIRRDLEALEKAGYPIVTNRAGGPTRWKLMDGFRDLPPVSFSSMEIIALAISLGFLLPLKGTDIGSALDSAFGKVTASLPAPILSHMKSLKANFVVGLGPHKKYAAHRETIEKICDAIEKKRNIQMRYRAVSRGETTRREVSPYQLWYSAGSLYLIGWCHKRESERMFAVDRIESIALTDNPYSVPFTFDAREFMKDAFGVVRGKPEDVDLVFEPRTAAWVGEKIWHPSQTIERLPRKRLRLNLNVAVTPELAAWVTSFGGEVEVIRPQSLRDAVQRAAEAIVRRYGREDA